MLDIWLGMVVMLSVAAGLSVLGVWLGRRLPGWSMIGLSVLVLVSLVAFEFTLRDSLVWARIFPVGPAIVLGDLLPPIVGLLAGCCWGLLPGRAWRRLVLLVPFVVMGAYRSYGPMMLEEPPPTGERWVGGVCMQTSLSTCSAAAAATLLRSAGIEATEEEMARLCLTRAGGTSMLGLYRGLSLKSAGTEWKPEVFTVETPEALHRDGGPAVISVALPRRGAVDPRYQTQWGWHPGVKHTVVSFGLASPEWFHIADPAVGRERWTAEDLRVLWQGQGIRLVRR